MQYLKSLKNVLAKDYKQKANEDVRQRLYANLRYSYGPAGEYLVTYFMQMSDADLLLFFKLNSDIDLLIYDSNQYRVANTILALYETAQSFVEGIEKRNKEHNQ